MQSFAMAHARASRAPQLLLTTSWPRGTLRYTRKTGTPSARPALGSEPSTGGPLARTARVHAPRWAGVCMHGAPRAP